MKNNNETIEYIRAKKIIKHLTESAVSGDVEGVDVIENWLRGNQYANGVLKKLSNANYIKTESEVCSEICSQRSERVAKLREELSLRQLKKNKRLRLLKTSASIAAVLLFSFIIYSVTKWGNIESEALIPFNYIANQRVDEAVLTPTIILSSGKSIDLTAMADTISIAKMGTIIKSGNVLKYNTADVDSVEYNTLVVPSKYTYIISLIDGTEITLNANSTMRYPTKFVGDSREVYLSGEAYFKVKKDEKPFIVHCLEVAVKVYGTEFNIDASDKNIVKTVLLNGSVGVKMNQNEELFVKPNQMLTCTIDTNNANLEEVDCARYTAWKRGFFRCDNELLTNLLKDISKWYNISFKCENEELLTIRTTASLGRDLPIEEILKSIEIMENVKFIKLKGGEYQIK